MYRATLIPVVLLLCLAAFPAEAANVWAPIGPDGGQVRSLEVDPQHPDVIYAATTGGVFKSTDGGTSWIRSSRGLKRGVFNDVAVAPSDSSVVYAAGYDGVFVSRDGGASWRLILGLFALSVEVDPRDPQRVWAGSAGLYWSADGGATWGGDDTDLIARVADIAVDPFQPDRVYAAVSAMEDHGIDGVVQSTDRGVTWEALEFGPNVHDDYEQIAFDPTTPGLMYASFLRFWPGQEGVTWRSTDHGATWEETEGGYPLTVDAQGVVYAGDMRSTDHGQTWQQVSMPPDLTLSYAASPAGGGTLLAGTFRQGTFRSRDRSASWQPARDGLHATTVTSFVIDPQRPRFLYAGAGMGGAFKSGNSGASWRRTDADLPDSVEGFYTSHALGIDPRQPQTVYIGWDHGILSDSGFARSDDGGAHWTVLRDGDGEFSYFPWQILVDPGAPGFVYMTGVRVASSGGPCNVARSADRGETFQCLAPFGQDRAFFERRLVLDPARPGTLWVLEKTDRRLFKSTDRGAHWTAFLLRGLPANVWPHSLAIDPSGSGRMYLGTGDNPANPLSEHVWRSDDGGRTWRAWGRGFPDRANVTHLLVDARQPSILYAAVEHFPGFNQEDASGVYWSRDGGRTFRPAGLNGRVLQLTQDPKNPRKLYASIADRGIFVWIRP